MSVSRRFQFPHEVSQSHLLEMDVNYCEDVSECLNGFSFCEKEITYCLDGEDFVIFTEN